MGKLDRWLGQDLWNVTRLGDIPTPRPDAHIKKVDFKALETKLRADVQQSKRNRKSLRGQLRGR